MSFSGPFMPASANDSAAGTGKATGRQIFLVTGNSQACDMFVRLCSARGPVAGSGLQLRETLTKLIQRC